MDQDKSTKEMSTGDFARMLAEKYLAPYTDEFTKHGITVLWDKICYRCMVSKQLSIVVLLAPADGIASCAAVASLRRIKLLLKTNDDLNVVFLPFWATEEI